MELDFISMMCYIIANPQGIFLALKISAEMDITLKPQMKVIQNMSLYYLYCFWEKLVVEKLLPISFGLYYTTIKLIESYVVMNQKFNNPKEFYYLT